MTNEELAVLIQQGQREYIPALYDQIKKLLHCKARDYFNKFYGPCSRCGVELDDLIQEAYLAMLDAVRAFKPDTKNCFTSYLSYPVLNRFRTLTHCKRGIKDPLNQADSLEEPLSTENADFTRADVIPDESAAEQFEAVETVLYQSALHTAVEQSMEELDPKEREVIQCRYFENMTLQATGDRIGGNRERVRQREQKAFRTFRKPQIARVLKPFLYDELESSAYRGTGLQTFKNTGTSATERAVEHIEAWCKLYLQRSEQRANRG
jgi:RNA polymerase sigma factor (sigma-70 family)